MRIPLVATLAVLVACTPAPKDPDPLPATDCAMRGAGPALPKAVCTAGTRWAPGTKVFEDRTHDWGLDAKLVDGTRLAVADIDNDGWPDLLVRQVGVHSDDFKPDGKRHQWILRNTGHGTFEDVTESSGFLATRTHEATTGRPGEVWAFGDVDNDGDIDGYTGLDTESATNAAGETSEIMLNDGHGHFTLGPADSAIRRVGALDNPGGASFVDFDRDGKLDLWVPQNNTGGTPTVFLQSRLYKGDGAGGFVDVTEERGLKTEDWVKLSDIDEGRAHARAWSSAACDLNGDGLPELLTGSYGRAPNHLFQAARRADGSIGYVNRSVVSGYAYDKNFSWQDNQFARCWCQANQSSLQCVDIDPPSMSCGQDNWDPDTDTEAFRLGGNSGTTLCTDLDNDGDLDLVTSEIQHWWAGAGADRAEVLVNGGATDVVFDRPGRESMGIVVPHLDGSWDEGIMTSAVLDFDNDGWTDLYWGNSDYAGNHGLLYHQKSALQFESVPIAEGIDLHRSHGVVVADFDRDGDLDMVVGHSRSRCDPSLPDDCYPTGQAHFFENVLGSQGNWVQLSLEGCSHTNRAAIGARVSVTAGGVTQTQEVEGGHGHFGMQNDHVLHFGLGAACEADVTVRWPNVEETAQIVHVVAGHRYKLHEGGGPAVDDVAR